MTAKQAIKELLASGYKLKNGKGSHVILRKNEHTIIIPEGGSQLSHGMVGRVRAYLKK